VMVDCRLGIADWELPIAILNPQSVKSPICTHQS